MARYRYKRGEKPLDGYTIEHALGVGGFGEVYYAVSDSGREVALKAVQNYEDVELRGIRNCMNLKSPHLVTIFDVRHNDQEEPFVIMEYVQGPSLRELLDNAPEGLGATKAAFFLREIAKGLTYLHDAGVVHRDLKPHNVFYEDGFVKIGDYSLCKLISTSHRTGHTMTVGSVHYMAPEISEGRYDASVDIYALGIILYEMLTGTPPFIGDSMGEILMKHMTAEPNLANIDEPFRGAIAGALAKDPAQRFASPAAMVAAVFGSKHVESSVVEFNPQELTVVAQLAAKRVLTTPSGRHGSDAGDEHGWTQPWRPSDAGADSAPITSFEDALDSSTPTPPPPPSMQTKASHTESVLAADSMPASARYAMAAAATALIAVITQILAMRLPYEVGAGIGLRVAAGIVVSVTLVRFIWQAVLPSIELRDPTRARLGMGGALMIPWMLSLPIMPISTVIAFVVFDWNQLMQPGRETRIKLKPVLVVAAIAVLLGFRINPTSYPPMAVAAIAAGIALCLQLVSPLRGGRRPALGRNPIYMATPAGEHSIPVNQYSSIPVAKASTERPHVSNPMNSLQNGSSPIQVLKSVLAIPGTVLFVASCILGIVELSTVYPAFNGGVGPRATPILAMVGFGLIAGAIGLMVASGIRHGFWPVARLFVSCIILAALHYHFIVGDSVDQTAALTIPVSMLLFAWPSRSRAENNQ